MAGTVDVDIVGPLRSPFSLPAEVVVVGEPIATAVTAGICVSATTVVATAEGGTVVSTVGSGMLAGGLGVVLKEEDPTVLDALGYGCRMALLVLVVVIAIVPSTAAAAVVVVAVRSMRGEDGEYDNDSPPRV